MRLNIKKLDSLAGVKIYYHKSLGSTNTEAKDIAQINGAPFAVIAKKQTAGRGRMGRSFYSKGHGLYMSFVYRTKNLCEAVSVTTATAAIVTSALESCCEGEFKIKWVNDIYQNGKKVCGILAESHSLDVGETAVVIGIGINVGRCRFPRELRNIAGSVNLKSSPEALVSAILLGLLSVIDNPEDKSYMQLYRDRSMLMGMTVTATSADGEIVGKVEGFDDDGGLLLRVDGEIVRIFSGEVTLRPVND